jgi:hypothetical protein
MKWMTLNLVCAAVVTWLTFGAPAQAGAQLLTNRAFDIVLQDDDPGAVFTFDLSPDPFVPSVLRFDGFFQNLEPLQTVVRYDLTWTRPDGGFAGSLGIDWTPLPGSGQLPVQFEQFIAFTPASVDFHIEGGGPTDHFRFVGDFTSVQVPEPTVITFLGTGTVLGLLCRRFNRTKTCLL